MTDLTLFVGLDVHKKTIAVAVIEGVAGAAVRFYGTIANTPETVRTLCRKLSRDGQQLYFCYEAPASSVRMTVIPLCWPSGRFPTPRNGRNRRFTDLCRRVEDPAQ